VPWVVHAYTATSAVLAFLALRAAVAHDYRAAFLWLAVAVIVDATDGWLARVARVKERIPHFDGGRLDDIVDYLTFVFVPLFLLDHAERLPPSIGWLIASVPLLASGYGFSRDDAKTTDHYFTGFPSYWNIVALYMVALRTGPWVNAVWLLVLAVLIFVRIRYVYPSRTPTLRMFTLVFGGAWGIAMLAVIWLLPEPPLALVYGSLAFPVYYAALSLYLHGRS
jgi:phosphatidylcholine synthase